MSTNGEFEFLDIVTITSFLMGFQNLLDAQQINSDVCDLQFKINKILKNQEEILHELEREADA